MPSLYSYFNLKGLLAKLNAEGKRVLDSLLFNIKISLKPPELFQDFESKPNRLVTGLREKLTSGE